ncbi:PKD domain-containing protein [Kordia periserrulae]|uniref:PKD domain-containing protein n=1 Tax=Kordia periserrulae TaxID=701523 RepID=A0A2T6C1P3_9FLAO|nr:PKD domain-containing protein [Kordia periserrulae]PTX62240.1 PKD domain-containing protein [Kordia periserrulae]
MKKTLKIIGTAFLLVGTLIYQSCDIDKFEPLEANSIADATPPEANFTFTQGQGAAEEWKDYTFANLSTSATMYAWNFGDGNTSTEVDGANTYPGEGTYTVTLTASDALGVTSTFTQTIEVIEPEAPLVADPVLVNADFDKLPKSSGSDCCCAGWINKDLGDQGESSSGNGGSDNVVKFDNNEPDHVYQEFAVTPNADYTITIVTSFKNLTGGSFPSELELRVLAGSGYIDGYSPTYYTNTVDFPQEDWGYTTIAQVEDPANNLLLEVQTNPSDDSYFSYTYSFNAGANDSVALFIRGIGGDSIGDFNYTSGDEEIRADSVVITAVN